MLYVGVRIDLCEAGCLFGANLDDFRRRRSNWQIDHYDLLDFIDYTMSQHGMEMGIHSSLSYKRNGYKGHIIGYEIDVEAEYVDSFVTRLVERKADFKREIAPFYEKPGAVVPEPRVIHWDYPDPTIPRSEQY
jgi:hypothetical protein